jgi:hypothetical protein
MRHLNRLVEIQPGTFKASVPFFAWQEKYIRENKICHGTL